LSVKVNLGGDLLADDVPAVLDDGGCCFIAGGLYAQYAGVFHVVPSLEAVGWLAISHRKY
jgi:hypothetical protein